ncbi:DUF4402 domain-containing protein [Sphingorhabdus sp. M41]|uniref:DUF4402 domain-containing protein n=1 Tax=Sphingorhabdus sp. M41 TaxID=1806885 RepID=UPI00078EC450|nr:DUF4402 domain-containing protein [Sphingorhabdus sp. M41]AMO72351.1 hypothetical protein AZE99_11250 [Sphingorhabdus sp. M41]
MWNNQRSADCGHVSGAAAIFALGVGSLMIGIAPASARSARSQVSAEIEVPLTIRKLNDMNFGDVAPGSGESRLLMSNNGSIDVLGTATHLGGSIAQAAFEITGPPNGWVSCNFGLPTIELTNGSGDTMTVEHFTFHGYQRLSSQGRRKMRASGDLVVAPNQAPGDYVGEFDVTIDFQ